MTSQTDDEKQAATDEVKQPYGFISPDEALRIIDRVTGAERDEPEELIRMLLVLFDHAQGEMQDAIYNLIWAAFCDSSPCTDAIKSYLNDLRGKSNPE